VAVRAADRHADLRVRPSDTSLAGKIGGLIAFGAMREVAARALQPANEATTRRLLQRLGRLWGAPSLVGLAVALNPRLRRTLGRLVGSPWRVELGPAALADAKRLREVVTHEAAHAAIATSEGAAGRAPHGPEWRQLMARAGYPAATGAHGRCRQSPTLRGKRARPRSVAGAPTWYEHWCPVCQSSRLGRRPVKSWRCAVCVAAGLDGRLEITPRAKQPTRPR
jgi:predicted SprT family Zn-dependent metalloprotease